MIIKDNKTPVLILNCKIGALAIMRSLGALGVPIYGVDEDPHAPALMSRYCKGKFIKGFAEDAQVDYLEYVLCRQTDRKNQSLFQHLMRHLFLQQIMQRVKEVFYIPENDPALVRNLASKKRCFLAKRIMCQLRLQNFLKTLKMS